MLEWHLYIDEGGWFGSINFYAYSPLYHFWHKKRIHRQFENWGGEYLGKFYAIDVEEQVDVRLDKINKRFTAKDLYRPYDKSDCKRFFNDKEI